MNQLSQPGTELPLGLFLLHNSSNWVRPIHTIPLHMNKYINLFLESDRLKWDLNSKAKLSEKSSYKLQPLFDYKKEGWE
jgi:hypothetical protein